jgi:hypothetical protein
MGATKRIPREHWQSYFAAFMRRHLRSVPSHSPTATIERLSASLGVEPEVTEARFEGIDYDPSGQTLEVQLEGVDHLVFYPAEIWVVEEDDGFVSALQVVRTDGSKEITRIERGGVPAPIYPEAAP